MSEFALQRPLIKRRYTLEVRQQMAWHWQALILAGSMILGLLISGTILVVAGVPAGELLSSTDDRRRHGLRIIVGGCPGTSSAQASG